MVTVMGGRWQLGGKRELRNVRRQGFLPGLILTFDAPKTVCTCPTRHLGSHNILERKDDIK